MFAQQILREFELGYDVRSRNFAHSYMDDQLERKLSLYDLLTNQNGYMPYLKKNDPSWRYIGLGKRSDHEERFIKRLPPNRYAMIGLGR
ncbi:unnamed protein product [Toxocara canis]|uniref:Peptidase_M16_C domain-containing protein n=1 Tax=Toxocara canis TaxID=6265 RepID=A0A183VH44_TOXCA|nr:unnamed protein product [Toxocara canis]